MTSKQRQIIELARQHGAFRAKDLAGIGATRSQLPALVSSGHLRQEGRGLYRLADQEISERHSLVEAVKLQAKAVICLISALSFHEIGTQLPGAVWLAIPRDTYRVTTMTFPLRITVLSEASYKAGIDLHTIEGVQVPVYNIPKTIADCFKFRNKVGLDVAIEALREAIADRRCTREEIRHYAGVNKVEKIMRPYMEMLST